MTLEEFEPLTSPESVSNDSFLLMQKIANNSSLEGFTTDSDSYLRKIKLYVVVQAYKELDRIIKMTNLLDKLEAALISTVEGKLEENPNNLQLITTAMSTCTESLNRANALVAQVLKDDRLSSVVINTTNIITPDGESASMMSMDSRDAVRNLASSLLAQLRHIKDGGDIVDVEENTDEPNESK